MTRASENLTIDQAVGKRLLELRDESGLTDEDIAAAARDLGIPWSRNTVVGIGFGKKGLNVAEFLLLPRILEEAFTRTLGKTEHVSLEDLLPDSRVDFGGSWIEGSALRDLLRDGSLDRASIHAVSKEDVLPRRSQRPGGVEAAAMRRLLPDDPHQAARIERDALGDAETKLARGLGTLPELVVIAAIATWGRTLSDERDARLEALDVATEAREDPKGRSDRLRVPRGHITRALAKEIQEQLVLARQGLLEQLTTQLGLGYGVVREAAGGAERRIAGKLGTISELVVLAAHELYGHSASDELSHRIGTSEPQRELRARAVVEMAVELAEPLGRIRDLLTRGEVPQSARAIEG